MPDDQPQPLNPGQAPAHTMSDQAALADVPASIAKAATTPVDPLHTPYAFSLQQRLYIWLVTFCASSLIVADIVGVKLFHISLSLPLIGPFSVEHTAGMLTFPLTFLVTDLLNEYYGKKGARRATFISFSMALYVFVVINIAQAMPYLDAPYNVDKKSFDTIFGSAKMMYIASLAAFIVGSLIDIFLFSALKRLTAGKFLWLRATGSTIVSQAFDSLVVSYIFLGLGKQLTGQAAAEMDKILGYAATGYILKFVIAVCLTPLIYLGHGLMHRYFGLTPVPADRA